MRILIVDTYYPVFLNAHYAQRPDLAKRPYEEQLASLMERAFGTGEAYPRELRALGHGVEQVIPNCLPLQTAWAREQGAARLARSAAHLPTRIGAAARAVLFERILQAQVRAFDPSVVYFQDLWVLRRSGLDRLRAQGRLVVGQIASEPPAPDVLRGYDLIVTSFPHFVGRFRDLGVHAEELRIAFDQALLPRLDVDGPRQHDVVFAGGLNPATHGRGTALLEQAARELPLDVWGYGADTLDEASPLRAAHRGEVWGLDMLRVLARSKIVLNRHIDVAEGHANNMRLYEATGAGALLLTDEGSNLADLFEPGREVVTYRDPNDLVEKARHYLAHEDERAAIAAAGHERTLREHTYDRRIRELAAMLAARVD